MNMLTLTTAALLASAIAVPAAAGPYVGADLSYIQLGFKPPQPQHLTNGLSPHVGWKFGEHIAFETGYSMFSGDGLNIKGPTIDGLAYLPIDQDVRLFATAGASYLRGDFKPIGAVDPSITPWRSSELGWRAGVGAEWRFVRVTARWQSMSFGGHESGSLVIGAGINIHL